MSRPTKEESIYKVSILKSGGYMYAATHPCTIDENENRMYVYRHWGVVDENKKCRDTACRPRHAVFPNVALLTDMTAMQTWESYGLWDEQEKYVQQMKSQQTCISSSHTPLRCLMGCAQ